MLLCCLCLLWPWFIPLSLRWRGRSFAAPPAPASSSEGKLPTSWSAKDNIVWSVEIKGRGWSSPVAWNNTVFVTSAISPGAFKAPSTGIFGNDYVAELAKQGLSEDEVVKKVDRRATSS